MKRRLTKKELEDRGHEYQVAYMLGHRDGYAKASTENTGFVEVLIDLMDPKYQRRVRKITDKLMSEQPNLFMSEKERRTIYKFVDEETVEKLREAGFVIVKDDVKK